jgi:hypothetical protein
MNSSPTDLEIELEEIAAGSANGELWKDDGLELEDEP